MTRNRFDKGERSKEPAPDRYREIRHKMVAEQIRSRGVSDPRVLDAMESVPRHRFVRAADNETAYGDHPLSIGYNQTISQPYIVALMTETAGLHPSDAVLEIGTGSGYQTAVLSRIVRKVYSIEVIDELAREARARLQSLGCKNVEVIVGDGTKGWPPAAPYAAIIVTAAPESVPPALLAQLVDGGRLVIPVGVHFQELFRIERRGDRFEKTKITDVRFVPLVGEG
jgi:protein-L-isoaspartate(D-aspartate) O-methyltransferase